MPYSTILVIIATAIIITILFFNYHRKKKRELQAKLEREERERQAKLKKERYNDLLNSFLPKVKRANTKLKKVLSNNKYICNFDVFTYSKTYKKLYSDLPLSSLDSLAFEGEAKRETKLFKSNFDNLKTIVNKANKNFVASELKKQESYFDNIEGKSLDLQQRKSVIIDEDNHIVVAGAGSGKTTTIAGKVKYLIDRHKISPSEILLIAFTRKAADEMRERIKKKMNIDISVKTFHKLGLDIISEVNNEKPSIFDLSKKETMQLFASFIQHAKKDKEYFAKLIHFFVYWLKPYKEEKDFDTEGERTNYLIDQKYEGLKIAGEESYSYKFVNENYGFKLVKKRIAGQDISYREKLKSQEEVLIANFLFTYNIEYAYEERYQYKTSSKTFGQYKPDFYLPEYDIYIEHFAIDRKGNVPDWFKGDDFQSAKEKYNAGIVWKREEHNRNETTLIETYSWEKREGVLLKNLERKLKENDVVLKPKSDEEIWQYIQSNTPAEIDNFTTLTHTFLVLLKSNNLSVSKVKSMAQKDIDERAILFLELFDPIYKSYNDYLQELEVIDFSDMINNATSGIKSSNFTSPYKYVIIDEFQDISLSRYQLVKSIIDKNPATKLFCVGDDWQSIYRFTGSDIGIFTDFDTYFKPSSINGYKRKTCKSYIEKTYRFDNQLIELSGNFVLKNPNQIRKTLKSQIQSDKKPFTILDFNYDIGIVNPLNEAINSIATLANGTTVSVKLLGRYSHEINEIKDKSKLLINYDKNKNETTVIHSQYPNLKINFHTVHSAKGLEADYIIILNGNGGKYGFPTEISDDPLLNFLLSKSDQFTNGEERRVFYVALTRARKHVFILSNSDNRSKFIDEIETNEKISHKKCEWCDNGILIERKGPFSYFYSCNNSHYCNYTRKIEPSDFIEKADKLQTEKEYSQAIDYYSKAIELDSKNNLTFFNLGRCHEEKGDKKEALHAYTKAINIKATHFNSLYWRASVNYDLNKFEDALSDWQNANKLNSGNSSTIYWIAKTEFSLSRFSSALKNINNYISIKQSDKEAFILRGECYAKNEQFQNAFEDWQKAKSLGHNNIAYYLNLYNINESSRNISKEIKIEGRDPQALYKAINAAISNNQDIQFNYQKSTRFSNGEVSKRTIKPTDFERISVTGSLCIKGYCYMRKEERVFAIERISNLIINPSNIVYWEE